MEGILDNGLTVIPSIVKTIKEIMSYFWQPSMSNNYYDENKREIKYQRPKKEIDKKKHLSLDNIMVLRIGPNDSYMVSMLGLKQSNCDERIILHSGQKEKTVIEKCLQDNLELQRKSILNYMPSDYIGIYNEALNIGRYDVCLKMLRGLELHINHISKEKNKLLLLKK